MHYFRYLVHIFQYLWTRKRPNKKSLCFRLLSVSRKNLNSQHLYESLKNIAVFTHESSYCFQRVLVISILSVHSYINLCDDTGGSVKKQCKLGSPNLHRRLPGRVSGTVKLFRNFEGPWTRALNEGGGKNLQVLANKSLYLNNGAR